MSFWRRVTALAVLVTPVLLIMFDLTVMGAALPKVSADLHPGADAQLWIVDIYSFVLAGLLVVLGGLGDRIGRRRLLLAGSALFGVASVLAAYAPDTGLLIAARALLGVGGATLMPATLSLIKTTFTADADRRRAIGIWSAGFAVGTAAGPVLGGWLLEHFWWGSVFLINVPLVLIMLVAGPLVLPESRDPRPGRFDLLSAGLSLAAMLPVVYAIKTVATHGVTAAAVLAAAVGGTAGVWFVRRQRALADPLLDLSLFGRPGFAVAVLTNTVITLAQVGLLLLIPQYLQLVVGMSPLAAGLWLLPGALAGATGALVAARLAERFPVHRLVGTGLAAAAAGTAAVALIAVGGGPVAVVVGMALAGLALSVVQTLTVDLVVDTAPADRAGAASAISETGFELGGALGVTILGTIAAIVYRGALPAGAPGETIGGTLSGSTDPAVLAAAAGAFTTATAVAAVVGAVILLAGSAQALRFLRPGGHAQPVAAERVPARCG